MNGQKLAVVEAVGVELGAVVEVARDDERVALHAALAGLGKPIGLAVLDQFDELVVTGRQVALEGVSLVRRVDGDGAHRLRCGGRSGQQLLA